MDFEREKWMALELNLWRYYRAELAREAIEHNKPKLPKINPYTSEASNEN